MSYAKLRERQFVSCNPSEGIPEIFNIAGARVSFPGNRYRYKRGKGEFATGVPGSKSVVGVIHRKGINGVMLVDSIVKGTLEWIRNITQRDKN